MSISDVLTTALKQAIVSVKDAIVNVFTQSSMGSVTQSVNTIVDSLSSLLKAYDFYASEQTKKVEAELKELQEKIEEDLEMAYEYLPDEYKVGYELMVNKFFKALGRGTYYI
jgi:vacuolar-type H+-ATPase subunit I/STV1